MEKILHFIKKHIPRRLFKALQPGYHFALNWIASIVYGQPSEELIVIGVTGTTGKTTTVYMIARMLEIAGKKVGFTSTAMFNDGGREWLNDKKMTMVGRFFTQKILKKMVKNGCRVAIVETTSEGAVQFRHRFINYDILVFTGLYPEHIESHGSFENYRQAKGRIFSHLSHGRKKFINTVGQVEKRATGLKKLGLEGVRKTLVVNGDDDSAGFFLGFPAERKILFSNKYRQSNFGKGEEVFYYDSIQPFADATKFRILGKKVNLKVLGAFNAGNAMAAFCAGKALGVDDDLIIKGLESISGTIGRLERINEGQPYTVIVDYAFEPGALKKLYETIAFIPHKKVIHVLGSAGGGRDVARRPKLGELAGKNADYVIVTNEDPYDEDPVTIIEHVAFGAKEAGKIRNKDLFVVEDRRSAIEQALKLANPDDLVLITGKGSEQAICIAGGEKIPWDDRAIVRGMLQAEYAVRQ